MSSIHHIIKVAIVPALFAFAAVGCDEMVEQSSDSAEPEIMEEGSDPDKMIDEDPDGYHEEQAEEGDEVDAPEAMDLSNGEAPVSEAVTYFRLMSKQTRTNNVKLCFEPLDDVAGAPLVQKGCNNNGLGSSNRQAFFKTTNLGYRIQYALKDRLTDKDLCVHMAGGPPALSNGVVAVLFQCDGTRPNQVFYATDDDEAGAVALIAEHSHRCLTVFGGLDSDLAILYQFDIYPQWLCDKAHQRWILKTDTDVFPWDNIAPNPWQAPQCVL